MMMVLTAILYSFCVCEVLIAQMFLLGWRKRPTSISQEIFKMSVCKSWLCISCGRSAQILLRMDFSVMADECTDVANNEQFVICIHWVDNTLTDNEDVIGLYNVSTIDSNTLVATIQDVLLCMNLKLTQCHGQCYDGASNMVGCQNGVATQLLANEKRAVLIHCYGHALNLAVGDSMK